MCLSTTKAGGSMERREFLGCAAAVSTAAITAGTAALAREDEAVQDATPKCKITVVKKVVYQDLYEKFTGKKGSICGVFEEGQEYMVTSPYRPPENFCAWAWADIRPSIHSVYFGGSDSSIVCCTDGFRPVVFNVEKV